MGHSSIQVGWGQSVFDGLPFSAMEIKLPLNSLNPPVESSYNKSDLFSCPLWLSFPNSSSCSKYAILAFLVPVPQGTRHAKRLNFDTSGFLEDPKLTRKQCDSRQKNYCEKPKNHKI